MNFTELFDVAKAEAAEWEPGPMPDEWGRYQSRPVENLPADPLIQSQPVYAPPRKFRWRKMLALWGIHIGAFALFAGGVVAQSAPATYTHPNANVERWHEVAIAAGWSEQDWPRISCIMEHPTNKNVAESRGDPNAYNGKRRDRSYGLMQLNTRGSLWAWFKPYVSSREQLFDPYTNLFVARMMSEYTGAARWAKYDRWKPWRSGKVRATCFR